MNAHNYIDPQVFIDAPIIGYDSETKDPDLLEKGPGCYRGEGYVCGVSFATNSVSEYYPIAHPDTTPEERERNLKIINSILAAPNAKVGANVLYDADWAQVSDMRIAGELHDVQIAEPLLNEYRSSYSLASLAKIYDKEEKATDYLAKYCEQHGLKGKPGSNIWCMPSTVVRHYAQLDGELALQIFNAQVPLLESQGLWDLYEMERQLLPLLLQMRKQGVRLNMPELKKTSMLISDKHFELQETLFEYAGGEFNIGSTIQLAKIFDKLGLTYPRNAPTKLMADAGKPGNPNLDKEALGKMQGAHPIVSSLLDYRHYDTIINMFLIPYLELNTNGRLHCSFNILRSDDYGTVSGRFSSSRPNLQQVPAMDDGDESSESLKGKIIRKLFIPEEDHDWAKLDYSQVEYRIAAHYAVGPGSEELREDYRNNPDTDYHQRIQEKTGFDRRQTKRLNFGASYGMGMETAAKKFGWTIEEAEMFLEGYHKAAPYLKATRAKVVKAAERKGYIYTLMGRRARVHPSRKLHSFFNRLIQGSAADVMKMGMVNAYKKGLFEILLPHLTVHDELDVSVPRTPEGKEALSELKSTMENALKLEVPLKVDCHVGVNWAEAD